VAAVFRDDRAIGFLARCNEENEARLHTEKFEPLLTRRVVRSAAYPNMSAAQMLC
jgi:hypothetical protein